MGNRAFITLNQNTYYVHWNGGPDTIYPMFKAIISLDVTPLEIEVCEAFSLFCSSKMELIEKDRQFSVKSDCEENGHYYIDLEGNTLIHAVEFENKETGLYDRKSFLVPEIHLKNRLFEYIDNTFTKDYQEPAKLSYQDRVDTFLGHFKTIMAERILREKAEEIERKSKENWTFKKLILEDLKSQGLNAIAKKIKSITQKSSVRVLALDLTKAERDTLESILNEYKAGYFDGMTDCYVYKKASSKKPRTAQYVFLEVKYSEATKQAARDALKENRGVIDEKTAWDCMGCGYETAIYRQINS